MTRMLRTLPLAILALAVAIGIAAGDTGGGGAGGGGGADQGEGGQHGSTGHEEQHPCLCTDLQDMRNMLKMVKTTRAAWRSVLDDIVGNAAGSPANMEQAKADFYHHMGWDSSTVTDIGKVSRTGDIVVDKTFAEQHCNSIVEGVKEHESAHWWYFNLRTISIFMMNQRELGIMLARSEIDSRNVQARYLSKAIKALRKKCGRDYSSDEDTPVSTDPIQKPPPN